MKYAIGRQDGLRMRDIRGEFGNFYTLLKEDTLYLRRMHSFIACNK